MDVLYFEDISLGWFNKVDSENIDNILNENVFIVSEHESASEQKTTEDDPYYYIGNDNRMDVSTSKDNPTKKYVQQPYIQMETERRVRTPVLRFQAVRKL